MQPEVITEANTAHVPFELTYTYGADYERIKGVLKQNGSVINTRLYFAGGFEKDVITAGATRYIQYISSPVGLVAIVESQGSSHTVHYTYTDHLGSIVTVTNGSATIEAQQSFDAWGRRRIFDSWVLLAPTETVPNIQVWLYRGYTGHEHLDQFGLINMNGRLYDPVLGRMLSPDNYISNAGYTQGYNRYSYAKNNPLLYTDPDGNNPIIGAIIGAASYTLGVAFSKGGFKNWNWFGFASSVVIGTMTGGFASELGGAVSTAVKAGELSLFGAGAIQVGAYAAFGGTTSLLTGGSFLSGALTGAAGSAMGSLTGLIPGIQTNGWGTAVQVGSSAAFGGVVAELSGGNFWNGAAQAAIIAGFNHAAHSMLEGPGPGQNSFWGKNRKLNKFEKMLAEFGLFPGVGIVGGAASNGLTTVGRWMSQAEYDLMKSTGRMVEGAGGKTSVATGGFESFSSAVQGSVYAEFQVPTSSLIQGGRSNWFSILGPNASRSQLFMLQKQGGQILPQIKNLSPILKVK